MDASVTRSFGFRNDNDPTRRCPITLVLNRRDIASLMSLGDYVSAVEAGFRSYANGGADVPLPMHVHASNGAFHAKSARLSLDRPYIALKLNGNFPSNPSKKRLPTIQGVVVLCDGDEGSVLAVMDSIEITLRRTAAATALAARYLARAESDSVGLCGCGMQGRAQLEALADIMPLRRVLVWDVDPTKAREFARTMAEALQIDVAAVTEPHQASRPSPVIVTATTARVPFLTKDMVASGAFVAAIGADSAEKSELAPDLMASAKIVVDLLAQAVTMGDLHHAIDAGVVTAADVHGELADIVVGRKPGRTSNDDTIVFDSTGTAIQDVATTAAIWQRAVANEVGSRIQLGAL